MDAFLKSVASNFWYEWQPEAKNLFYYFSPQLWTLTNRNPFRFLALRGENRLIYEKRFAELMTDPKYQARFQQVKKDFQAYMNPEETWISRHRPEAAGKTVAYFSMEYGIETLKIYSGGLGILSGDHVRGASDLGLKFAAVGLFYLQGYFEQEVTTDGEMRVTYDSIVPSRGNVREYIPLEPVKKPGTRDDLILHIQMDGRQVAVKVWRAQVGRADLLLLDTNVKENHVHDRHITRRLYASEKQHTDERKRRIEQEMILGIGGAMALHQAGYEPHVYHLNEGHVAFAALEIIRHKMKTGNLHFKEAVEHASKIIGFTTHTPVAAGNERFDEELTRQYLGHYLKEFASADDEAFIFNCARNETNQFDMTKLSLLLAGAYRNGVSQLHGEVCRKMWHYAWGQTYRNHPEKVPIGAITNGVHVPYWQAPEMRLLIDEVGGLEKANDIPHSKLWEVHAYRKNKLIIKVRERYAYHLLRGGKNPEEVPKKVEQILDPDAFIIAYARRFAGYKRSTFLLDHEERLFTLLENTYKKYQKPVNIIFAGKPHPNNQPGRDQITHIYEVSKRLDQRAAERKFNAQILFIEAYDIDLARRLVSGVDVWLNNPIRPMEASGTSGMKAAMNGVLNLSIPDGWCVEGIQSGENGWLFGKGNEESAAEDQEELFHLLEHKIIPLYFERPNKLWNYSPGWAVMMKKAVSTITSQFSIERMLIEYVDRMYSPAIKASLQTPVTH